MSFQSCRSLAFMGLCAVSLLIPAVAQLDLKWESLPPVPAEIGLGGPIVGTHNDVLLVGGGANFPTPLTEGGEKVWWSKVYALQNPTDEWREVGALKTPLAYASVVSTADGVVVIGGSNELNVYATAFVMSLEKGALRFRALPDFPVPTAFGSAEVIGSVLYVLAGKHSKDDTQLSGGFYSLDLSSDTPTWSTLPPPPGEKRFKRVTAVQREGPNDALALFAFSGSRVTRSANGDLRYRAFTDACCYSPAKGRWTQRAALPTLSDPRDVEGKERFRDQPWPISAGCAQAIGDDTVLTFSGSTDRYILDDAGSILPVAVRPAFVNRVLSYNTYDDSWHDATPMLEGVVTTRAVRWRGRIVVPSGETQPGVRTSRVQAVAIRSKLARLHVIDFAVLGVYLLGMVGIGVFFARRDKNTDDFFLGGHRIPWWAAGLSIFGTQLSAITFMAVPATAYAGDWRRFGGSIMMLPVFVLVIFCFIPVYRRLKISTVYEYLGIRFNSTLRLTASGLFILFQLARMGIVLLLPALALSAVTGVSVYLCILLMGVLATVYTALGGISAVVWTDVLQVVVLIGGAAWCLSYSLMEVGGIAEMWTVASAEGKADIFHWEWSTTDMVGWIVIVGFFFTNLVPYTTDQTVVQRYLTTKDEREARRSLWLNFAMTLPTSLLFYLLGTSLYVYYSSHPAEEALLPEKADQLIPWFVVSQLPVGVAGLLIAAIFAAAMSSLDSSMNSISSVVIGDFVQSRRSGEARGDGLRLARQLTVVLGVIGTVTAMILATFEVDFLFDFFLKLIGLLGGGIAGVFLLAVFSKRATAFGAWAGLIAGSGMTAFVVFCTTINFLLYAAIGCVTCVAVGYVASIGFGRRGNPA